MKALLAMVATILLAIPGAARAEQFVEKDGLRVHYVAINTTDIPPEVARPFAIDRSRRYGLVVLNAQRVGADGRTTPLPGAASGRARSLIGHVQPLAFRPVREGEVHYLVAEFETLNQEWLTFEISVTPEGAAAPLPIKFQQQFYTD